MMKAKRVVNLPANLDEWFKEFGDDFGFIPLVPIDTSKHVRREPGSEDRIRQMRFRRRRGQPIFSRHDLGEGEQSRSVFTDDPAWTTKVGDEQSGKEISACGKYLYRRWKRWSDEGTSALFIGLVANDSHQSLVNMEAMAKHTGCAAMQRVNLFAWKSESMQEFWDAESPIGDWNDRVIRIAAMESSFAVCCWGAGGARDGRAAGVASAVFKALGEQHVFCYGLTDKKIAGDGSGREVRYPVQLPDAKTSRLFPLRKEWIEDTDGES